MSWIVDKYEFIDTQPENITEEIPYKEPLPKKGVSEERLERIKELETLLERLNEENPDQEKIIKEKINTLLLLGRENMRAFRWKEAEEYLLKAKYLAAKVVPASDQEAGILFYLGDLYQAIYQFPKAIDYYKTALPICQKVSEINVERIYHQLGIVYTKQGLYEEALNYFNKALEWGGGKSTQLPMGHTSIR